MDPVALIPAPDAMPVHWYWLQLLLTLTTFVHLVAMNVLLGAGTLAMAAIWSKKEESRLLAKDIGHKLPFVLAITINFGVAPLLFLQTLYGQFFYTSTVLMAVYWLAIVGMLILAYYSAYLFHLRFEAMPRLLLPLMGATVLLLLVIAFFFTNNISLMQMPESWLHYFANREGWLLNTDDPTLVPRYLHFLLSGIAVGGLAVALFYDFKKRRGDTQVQPWIKMGTTWFGIATAINFGIGFWFLGSLPPAVRDFNTSEGQIFITALLGSVAVGVVSVIKALVGRVRSAAIWALATVFLMVVCRDVTRITYLKPYMSLGDLPVQSQYSPFLLFLLLLAGAVALVRWMLNLLRKGLEVKA